MSLSTLVWCTDPVPLSPLGYILCTVVSSNPTSVTLRRVKNSHDPSDDFDSSTDGNDHDWLDDMYEDDVIVRPKLQNQEGGYEGVFEANEGGERGSYARTISAIYMYLYIFNTMKNDRRPRLTLVAAQFLPQTRQQ